MFRVSRLGVPRRNSDAPSTLETGEGWDWEVWIRRLNAPDVREMDDEEAEDWRRWRDAEVVVDSFRRFCSARGSNYTEYIAPEGRAEKTKELGIEDRDVRRLLTSYTLTARGIQGNSFCPCLFHPTLTTPPFEIACNTMPRHATDIFYGQPPKATSLLLGEASPYPRLLGKEQEVQLCTLKLSDNLTSMFPTRIERKLVAVESYLMREELEEARCRDGYYRNGFATFALLRPVRIRRDTSNLGADRDVVPRQPTAPPKDWPAPSEPSKAAP
ncbi:hypothetical protein CCUS01_06733 [Colletotrichum cuscutae]|uniref:Uncharacterized protein n=1 Tax=Colletotrichum cuscutae TaxID=1209917 RepID=A0AAI9V006_9PEZI|nr:hypothetical protein CCUS01_06733 [Colletotrichum cuscutae]